MSLIAALPGMAVVSNAEPYGSPLHQASLPRQGYAAGLGPADWAVGWDLRCPCDTRRRIPHPERPRPSLSSITTVVCEEVALRQNVALYHPELAVEADFPFESQTESYRKFHCAGRCIRPNLTWSRRESYR